MSFLFKKKYFNRQLHNDFNNKVYLSYDNKYVLKIYNNLEYAKRELYGLNKCQKALIPTPEVIDYSLDFINILLVPYIVIKKIRGRPLLSNKTNSQNCNRILCDDLIKHINFFHKKFLSLRENNRFLNKINRYKDKIIKDLSNYENLIDKKIFNFNKIKEQLHKPIHINYYRPTLIHGDLRNSHFLYENNRLTAIIDWEFCERGDYFYDLAFLLKENFKNRSMVVNLIKKYYGKDINFQKVKVLIFYLKYLCLRDIYQCISHIVRINNNMEEIYKSVSNKTIMIDIKANYRIIIEADNFRKLFNY